MKTLILFLLLFPFSLAQEIPNLAKAKELVIRYYESPAHDSVLRSICEPIRKQIATETFSSRDLVIFDIDETALSNYSHIKEMDFGYVPSLWNEWVQKGEAVPITPVFELYQDFISRGASVAFITGRNNLQYDATFSNLLNTGYSKFDTLIVKEISVNYPTAADYKQLKRQQLVESGYRIIFCIGDQMSDLAGENAGVKIKLPNYLYLVE